MILHVGHDIKISLYANNSVTSPQENIYCYILKKKTKNLRGKV